MVSLYEKSGCTIQYNFMDLKVLNFSIKNNPKNNTYH